MITKHVYSIFVHLPGVSRESAFVIGNDIAKTITEMNPNPIQLKFEKVSFAFFRVFSFTRVLGHFNVYINLS